LVYVVAAYTLTISVLLIYGVLLQHRARLAGIRVGAGFNLGAALLAPVWAWFHGQRAVGATLLATCAALVAAQGSGLRIPALVLSAFLAGAGLWLGLVGNRIALDRTLDRAAGEAVHGQLPWAMAGAVLYTIVLPWVCYFWLERG
jgi:hypothetical protein